MAGSGVKKGGSVSPIAILCGAGVLIAAVGMMLAHPRDSSPLQRRRRCAAPRIRTVAWVPDADVFLERLLVAGRGDDNGDGDGPSPEAHGTDIDYQDRCAWSGAEGPTPAFITGSPARGTAAVKGGGFAGGPWSPESLSRRSREVPTLLRCKETRSSTVLNYVDNQPYENWSFGPGARSGVPYEPFNASVAEFWDRADPHRGPRREGAGDERSSASHDNYYYYNSHAAALGRAGADLAGFGPMARQLSERFARGGGGGGGGTGGVDPVEREAEVHVWFGSAGVTAHTHYDTSENVYLQIYGEKTFTLRPPSAHVRFGLFPAMHAGYRHVIRHDDAHARRGRRWGMAGPTAQPEDGGDDGRRGAGDGDADDSVTVVLRPGDVLYVPRYWLHSVEATTTSISSNLWVNSEAYWTAEKMYAVPLPFEESWSLHTRVAAFDRFAAMVVSRARSLQFRRSPVAGNPNKYIAALAALRFRPLFFPDGTECPYPMAELTARARTILDEDALSTKFRLRADEIAQVLGDLPDDGVRDMYLGNWIEYVSYWAVGAETVPSFLVGCWEDR